MSTDANRTPVLLGFGLLCLAAAALLAWFSSVTTLHLVRTGTTATLAFETRLFNLFVIERRSFADVTGVSVIRSRQPGVRSSTPDYLLFESRNGQIDAGYGQQHFAREHAAIDEFFQATTSPVPPELGLSSIDRGEELRRFVFAQMAVLFLGGLGLGMWWLTVHEFFGRRRAVGPIRGVPHAATEWRRPSTLR